MKAPPAAVADDAAPGASAEIAARATRTLATGASGAVAAISGIAPHVLHHVGPLAGSALLAGAGGTVLFGGWVRAFDSDAPSAAPSVQNLGCAGGGQRHLHRRLCIQRAGGGAGHHGRADRCRGAGCQPIAFRSRRPPLTARATGSQWPIPTCPTSVDQRIARPRPAQS